MGTGEFILAALLAAAPGAPAQPRPAPSVSAAPEFDRAEVVAEVRKLISERYVLPERRPALDSALAEGLKSGRYDVREPALLAQRINADLARVGRDHHLNLKYDPQKVAAMMARTPDDRPDPSAYEAQARRNNHGVRELKLLPGNVRYLDLAGFDWIGEESAAALNSAMAFLKGGDAVIIDLRRNGGGAGRAVHQVISHFMEPGKPLITFYKGSEASPTLKSLPRLSTMVGKPLYVLTSGGSASAAEEFVGHVAGYKLGELVGSTTAGAAYMNGFYAIEGGFELSLSEARPVLASTGKDWERVGIAPTLEAPVEAALETAHLHALRKLAASADPVRAARLKALAVGLEAASRPGTPAAALAAYSGAYGDRRITVEDGKLWYRQDVRPRRLMVPLGGNVFTLADDPLVRLTFQAAGGRMEAFDLGLAEGPVQGRFERTS
ncbi:MAG TPA: S41 family peptidase [Allosphingosinicella sp.]